MTHNANSDIPRPTMLVVAEKLPRLKVVDAFINVVGPVTTRDAVEILKLRAFDLVIYGAGGASELGNGWVQRLHAAMPYLPIIVYFESKSFAAVEESDVRGVGVRAMIKEELLEAHLEQWWVTWVRAYTKNIDAHAKGFMWHYEQDGF